MTTKTYNAEKIQSIRILKPEECETFGSIIPKSSNAWWLDGKGDCKERAACVFADSNLVDYVGLSVNSDTVGVRPALKIAGVDAKIGTKLVVGNIPCTSIGNGWVLADDAVCECCFSTNDSNDYNSSTVKKLINSADFRTLFEAV